MKREDFTVKQDGEEIKLSFRPPTYEELEESDRIYASKIAELIRDDSHDILLRSDIDDFLKRRGIWSEKDETKINNLQREIDELLEKMKNRDGKLRKSEARNTALQINSKRAEIVSINSKRQTFDDATAESIAENEKNDYLVSCCTVYADSGKPYWEDLESMKSDKMSEVYRKASVIAVKILFGYDPEFEKNLPENKWLIKHGFMDNEMYLVDPKTGNKVDRNGKPIESIVEETQKALNNLQGEIEEKNPYIEDEETSEVST